jgi:hypothetical protein
MMKKKPSKLNFKIVLSVFFTFTMAKLGFMRRDQLEFDKYGIDDGNLDDLEDLLANFQEIPTDVELLGNQVSATQQKDALAVQVRETIASIMTRAENKFGFHSGIYRKFGVSGISELNGGTLSYTGRRVHRVATGLLEELEDEGLTSELLDAFKTLLKNYEKALAAQEDAIADRDIATDSRIEKANAIYVLLARYCDTGKRIWESVNEAKYNDYVIYDTPSGSPQVEPEVAGETEI